MILRPPAVPSSSRPEIPGVFNKTALARTREMRIVSRASRLEPRAVVAFAADMV